MNMALTLVMVFIVLAVSFSRYILVEIEDGKIQSSQMRSLSAVARTYCEDLDPEFCKSIIAEHDCKLEPTVSSRCARTCNECLCKDHCIDQKCKDYCKTATTERCQTHENLRNVCRESC